MGAGFVPYIMKFTISRFVISRFECTYYSVKALLIISREDDWINFFWSWDILLDAADSAPFLPQIKMN